jgi:hypothetical protein
MVSLYKNIIHDTSTRGRHFHNHDCYRADIIINKVRYRKRSHNLESLILWVHEIEDKYRVKKDA